MNQNQYMSNNFQGNPNGQNMINVPFSNQPMAQSIIREAKKSSGSLPIVRKEIGFIYEFHSVGRYTSHVLSSFYQISTPRSSVVPFNMDSVESNTCKTHEELKEYILLEPVDKFKIHDTICKNCLSLLNYKRGSDYKAKLFDAVIMENKEKIKEIRNDKIKLGSNTNEECHEAFKQTIMPFIDELIYLSDTFEKEISGKIEGGNTRSEEIIQLKNFINSMELTNEGDPNVFGIGRNEGLKNKYIKLASFLIKYSRSNNDNNLSVSGMTKSLKDHIINLINLRRVIILRITDWLRYLLGGFYEEIHQYENVQIDENFRQNVNIDYVSEDELLKMKIFFENELRMRDDHIRFLEIENEKLRSQINELNGSLCVMSENEFKLSDMQIKFRELEKEWLHQKDIIESLHNELNKMNKLNSEYLIQIDGLRNEFALSRYDSERKLQQALEQMRMEYEKKISEINNNLNTISIQYSDLEKKYTFEVHQFEIDRENFNNQLAGYKKMYENEAYKLNSDIENLTKESITLKNSLNSNITELSKVIGERDMLRQNEENLRNQINQIDNSLRNVINQLNNITAEKDDYKTQINFLTNERDSYLYQIDTLKSQISGLEKTIKSYSSSIASLCDERDELKKQVTSLINERDNLANNFNISNNKIAQLENQINNILQQLNILINERDDVRNINLELNSSQEKMKNENQHLTEIVNNLEIRLKELHTKYDDFTVSYSKLQNEYNNKITLISNLEGKNLDLNNSVKNLSDQVHIYLTAIQKYEKDLESFRSQNDELRIKLLVIPEKESEITRLKQAISACREEWNKLSESYEQLLLEIKNQISVNESLRGVIFELQGKIENHNQQVNGLDNAIRQQIEILTRHTLAKKNIDYNPNNEKVRESTNKMDILRTKIGRLETQKLNKSAVFSNVGFAIEENQQKGGISIQRSNLNTKNNSNNMVGSTVYQGVKQVLMQELPNHTTTTTYYQQNNPYQKANSPYLNQGGYLINENQGQNYYGNSNSNENNTNVYNNYSQYRPSTTYDRMQGSNVFNNYIATGNNVVYPSQLNNNNQQYTSTTSDAKVINLPEEKVEDKYGLFNSPVNVNEEYSYQK